MNKILITILFVILNIISAKADDFKGVKKLISRRIPWLKPHVVFKVLEKETNTQDAFTLQTKNGGLLISATSPSAAAMSVNWYLKYYCHQSLSLQATNLKTLKTLPPIKGIVKQSTPFRYRYSLNYCTVNYTLSFYKWDQWAYVLDWLALNGVNIALAPVGNEKIWDLTLQDFNFNKKERAAFIAGPAFSAWWLMGNLEGWGGPVNDTIIDQQVQLQKNILNRMKELGIEPVMQGFYGMVPNALKQKYPLSAIIDQGKWAGGFKRPAMLSPQDSLFQKMATSYYGHIQNLYGNDFRFFGGDPFHEGGISKGIDMGIAGTNIYAMMSKAFIGVTWVLQGWGGNPNDKIITNIPADKVLILDLMGEDHQNWVSRNGYNGHNWILGSVNNFGENNGLYGKLEYLAQIPFKVLNTPEGKSLAGIGEIPEGYNNNPVLYDLIYDAAWQDTPVNLHSWINNYADFRYDKADQNIKSAWAVFLKTIYTSEVPPQQGAPESIFCARPSLNAEHARTWGTLKRSYNQKEFEAAVRLFAKSIKHYKNSATYQYDLVDFVRQVISNQGQDIYELMVKDYQSNDKQAFKKQSAHFLELIKMQNTLLQTLPAFRLDTWLKNAYNFGRTPADKKLTVWNAKTQISYWGPDNTGTDLHEYANKEWGGLMGTLYMDRWQAYINYLNKKLEGKNPVEPNFFEMETRWANASYHVYAHSNGNAITKVLKVLNTIPFTIDQKVDSCLKWNSLGHSND